MLNANITAVLTGLHFHSSFDNLCSWQPPKTRRGIQIQIQLCFVVDWFSMQLMEVKLWHMTKEKWACIFGHFICLKVLDSSLSLILKVQEVCSKYDSRFSFLLWSPSFPFFFFLVEVFSLIWYINLHVMMKSTDLTPNKKTIFTFKRLIPPLRYQ